MRLFNEISTGMKNAINVVSSVTPRVLGHETLNKCHPALWLVGSGIVQNNKPWSRMNKFQTKQVQEQKSRLTVLQQSNIRCQIYTV